MKSPIAPILIAHGIQIKLIGNRLHAFDVVTDKDRNDVSTWIDVEDFGPAELMNWLGY